MTDKDYKSNEKCPTCNSLLILTKTENTVHYGMLDCPCCRKFIKWFKNPESKEKNRDETSKYSIEDIIKHRKMEYPLCFFCLRKQDQLGIHETLTRDHIIEIDKGGDDILDNLQILCSACHKLKNWARLYLNWHFKDGD